MKTLNNIDVQLLAIMLSKRVINAVFPGSKYAINMITIYGVPRGGIPVVYLVRGYIGNCIIVDNPEEADVIIDDNILRIQQYLEDNKDEKVIEKLKKLIKGISL